MRIIIAVAAALFAAACSSTSSKPAAPPASPTSSSRAATTAPTAAQHAAIGSTITVKTSTGPINVTLVKVVDPTTPKDPNMHMGTGDDRWVAVQLRFVNAGPATVSDSLYGLGGADADGQQIRIEASVDVAAGPSIDILTGLHLSSGDALLGYIVYKVPKGARLARVQYIPQGGSMAEWAL